MKLPNATGKWNWYWLSKYISISIILSHPNLPWDKDCIIFNSSLVGAPKHVLDQIISDNDDLTLLSKKISISDILSRPDLPWSRKGLSGNKEITLELVDRLEQVLTNLQGAWDWCRLTEFIPVDKVRSRPDLPWDMNCLASNPGITVDDILYMSH